MDLKEIVYDFPTKYEEGFTKEEIERLIKSVKVEVNLDKFNDALRGITCVMKDKQLVIYHCDILTALRCGIENRCINFYELD